jgi:hypothetical protein
MAGGDAGLEDQVLVVLGDAVAVVDDGEGSVAPQAQDGGDEDVAGSGIASVAHELEEGVLHAEDAGAAAADALDACEAGEARAQVPVGSSLVGSLYRATSLTRLSRITVTLIWPGYSRSLSICLEMSKASLAAMRSSTSLGWTITRISRPAWMA